MTDQRYFIIENGDYEAPVDGEFLNEAELIDKLYYVRNSDFKVFKINFATLTTRDVTSWAEDELSDQVFREEQPYSDPNAEHRTWCRGITL